MRGKSAGILVGKDLAKFLGFYPPHYSSELYLLYRKTVDSDYWIGMIISDSKSRYRHIPDIRLANEFLDYVGLLYVEPKDKEFRECKYNELKILFNQWQYLKLDEEERNRLFVSKLDKACRLHARLPALQKLVEVPYHELSAGEILAVEMLCKVDLLTFERR